MIYRFDEYCIDPEGREILRSGVPVAVQPQVFELVVCLAENSERVVSKDEMVQRV